MDVRQSSDVRFLIEKLRPDIIFHLAAIKYVQQCEDSPILSEAVNSGGFRNVIESSNPETRVVLVSTCKACDSTNFYGKAKSLAEQLAIGEAHGKNVSVARLFNVWDSKGNVFDIWRRQMAARTPLTVSEDSERYFMSKVEAVALLIFAAMLKPGRIYTMNPGQAQQIGAVAERLYPHSRRTLVAPRRGDRLHEPRHAAQEVLCPSDIVDDLVVVSKREKEIFEG